MQLLALLNPMHRFVLNFPKSYIVSCFSKFDGKKKSHRAVFEIEALKAEIKGAFSRLQCCYSNLLCHENDTTVFNVDWAVFGYHDCSTDKEW